VPDHLEPRLAAVETAVAVGVAEVRNVAQGVTDIKLWLTNHTREYRENQETKEGYHVEIVQRLATIEENQAGFKNYQIQCEKDRKAISDDVEELKFNQSNQSGKSSIIGAIGGAIFGGFVAIIAAILGRGHS